MSHQPVSLLLQRLETAQQDCMDDGQAAAAILLQDARGLLREQAKRIEALEVALEVIAETANYLGNGEGVVGDLEKIARAALAPEQGK